MLWILYAVVAHVGNAVVFAVDKTLLGGGGAIGRPSVYAAYSGLVAAGAAVLLPFAWAPPNGFVAGWSLLAGLLWVAALWFFFTGLKHGEASRVVPVAGSAVPVFTFVFAWLFLNERLAAGQLAAVGLLIAGGILLSLRIGPRGGLPARALWAAVAAGAAFAGYFASVDFLYDGFDPFLAAFAYNRMGVGLVALVLLVLVWKRRDKNGKGKAKTDTGGTWLIGSVFLGNKALAMVALLLQNWAIDLGSVTVVNALQGTQYAFLLLLAYSISRWRPSFFKEQFGPVARWQKIGGTGAVAVGLVLLVL